MTNKTRIGISGGRRMRFFCRRAFSSCFFSTVAAICIVVCLAARITAESDTTEIISLQINRSKVIRPPWPVKRVSIAEPKIANVEVLSPDQVLLMGKSAGTTDLLMWNEDEKLWQARVSVHADVSQLKADLVRLFPKCDLEIRPSLQDILIVTGNMDRAEHVAQLHKFLYATGMKYNDMTSLAGVQQVMIQIKMAEVSRQAIRTLGINVFHTGDDFFGASLVGSESGGPINPVSIGVPGGTPAGDNLPFVFTATAAVSPSVTLFAGFPDADLQFFIEALAENQYLRILARPTLVALSGEKASFLAGGEFPIPVTQGAGAGDAGTAITIEYKEFGVRLDFRPIVLGDNRIRLYVAPEVSSISDIGAVIINGFRIPSIVLRRAETTLELKSGKTFAMAGLIDSTVNARTSRIPWIGDVPVLGALFRSVRYEKRETELVVLVTASLVEPMSVASLPPTPGVMHVPPNDWELYAEGRIEGRAEPKISVQEANWLKEMGINKLKGPGAWATYDQPAFPSRAESRVPRKDLSDTGSAGTNGP